MTVIEAVKRKIQHSMKITIQYNIKRTLHLHYAPCQKHAPFYFWMTVKN